MQFAVQLITGFANRWKRSLVAFALLILCLLYATPALRAQSTATLTGLVTDPRGSVIAGATVTIMNEATQDARSLRTNRDGVFAVPNLPPSTYSIKIVSQGFAPQELTGVEVHAGDSLNLPDFKMLVGAVTDTVVVQSAAGQMMETANGQRSELLSYQDIQDLALEGRDTSELLKVLPGVSTITSGNVSTFNPQNITAGQSAIGQGLNTNGAPNRGGTTLLLDGVNIIDPGANFSSLVTVNPEMTQEVNVLSTNFGADTPYGPVVISSVSKSGGAKYHGGAYYDIRNDALNANDWVSNHLKTPQAGANYNYPGGSFSGPVPFTRHKVFFYGGVEFLRQNLGNNNVLNAYIPTSSMLKGDFSTDAADNQALCPGGFTNTTTSSSSSPGWCNNIASTNGNTSANTIFPDGSRPIASTASGTGTNPNGIAAYAGGTIPNSWIDPNMIALTKLWPKATYTNYADIQNNQGFNYHQVVPVTNNGWIYRLRGDYNWTDATKLFISYQQGYSQELAQAHGCNIYFTPGNCLMFPGGGLTGTTYSKMITGHLVHIFSPTLTDEFIASWVYGSIPYAPPNPSADYRSAVGFNAPTIYGGGSKYNPTYGGANWGYPGISQPDIFEPSGFYTVKKEVPSFADNLTKVWGNHLLKFGAYTSNTDNLQGNMGTNMQGALTIATGQTTNYIPVNGYTGNVGTYNPTAAFVLGNLSNYAESNSSPLQDLAYQVVAFYANDTVKINKNVTMEVGFRIEHIGHWYDRQGTGLAVFFPQRVLPDFYAGKVNPGYYWHGIDPGVPLSGQPNRLAYVSPRFGLSYDIFGTGKTLIRGGWGAYRFGEQYNDASNTLTTAQAVKQFSASAVTGGKFFQLSQLGQLVPPNCQTQCATTSTQYGWDASDYGIPLTYSYNMSIDQKLPWQMLLDVAYVGNQTSRLSDLGASLTTGGGLGQSYANQNKVPLGAFFKPDPQTGVTSCNPENLGAACSSKNNSVDYYPYGKTITGQTVYGSSAVYQAEHIAYSNYNGLQVALVKRAGPVTLNINGTWSKALGTINNVNPFDYRRNYGFDTGNRPFIFNSSYVYRVGNRYHGNKLVEEAINGWTISGITLWQQGQYTVPTISYQYDPASIPASAPAGTTTGISSSTYFGTNAGLTIQPTVNCNPTSGLAYHQVYKACYAPPAVGSIGGVALPYVPGPAYMENDLAVYKSFAIHEEQKVQVRISAFNWLNHPLPTFSSQAGQTTEYYLINYQTKAITPNTALNSPTFGYLDYKSGAPSQRIMEFNVKYTF